MQQVDPRMARRGRRADGSGPLPQFDLGRWDAFDPDRTLERLPVIPDAAPTPVWFGADDVSGPASGSDADMAVTVEIIPEIGVDDILEAAPAPRAPLLLPPRVAVPIDLDRLLAQARAETRKSVDYFHPSTPTPLPVVTSVRASRQDPTVAIARAVPDPFKAHAFLPERRRFGWVVGTVLAAAVATVAVAALESSVSSARSARATPAPRSPASVTVTTPGLVGPVVKEKAFAATAGTTNEIPTVSFQSLPAPQTGRISLAAVAASHRLFIDGHLATGDSQLVTCGRHLVQVGSRGTRKYVSVACGQELVLAR